MIPTSNSFVSAINMDATGTTADRSVVATMLRHPGKLLPESERVAHIAMAVGSLVLAAVSSVAAVWIAMTPETWWLAVLVGLWTAGFLLVSVRATVGVQRLPRRDR